jgi:hypothetical protein
MDNKDSKISVDKYNDAKALIHAFKSQQEQPKPLEEPINYSKLKEATERYIELLQHGKIGNDDFKEEIFVEALEAVFGRDVWEWVRAHIKIDSAQQAGHLRRYLGKK